MGVLMFRCPTTGREISTGREIGRSGFDCSPAFSGRTPCPICRVDHEWRVKDAWVKETRLTFRERHDERPDAGARRSRDRASWPGGDAQPGNRIAFTPASILRLNIQRYRALLQTERDPVKLSTIRCLLAEAEDALARCA